MIIDITGKIVRELNTADNGSTASSLLKIDRFSLEAGMFFVDTHTGKMQKIIFQ